MGGCQWLHKQQQASFVEEDEEEEEEDGEQDSESLLDTPSLNDSLDLAPLFISHAAGTSTTPQKTPKKTPNKDPTRVVPALSKCKINLQYFGLDHNIIAPHVFLHNGRRAAAVTIQIPNNYSEADVSAFMNDGGHALTLKFCAPKDFLTTFDQAATKDATVGSSLGEAYVTFIQNLPSSSQKKLVIDIPFKAQECLCPEVPGKFAFMDAIYIIDVDLGNGKNGCQIILALYEVLRDDLLNRESVAGRRVFWGSAGGGGQQPPQQQKYHQEHQHHTNQQQHHGYEHHQRRTHVQCHDEIDIVVGNHDIAGSNA